MRLDHLLSMENRNPITRDVRTDSYSEIVPTERVGLGIKGPRGNYERGTLVVVPKDLVVQLSVIQKITETAKQKSHYGGVAQLGEHLPCKQGVMGSNPIISTRNSRGEFHLFTLHSSLFTFH